MRNLIALILVLLAFAVQAQITSTFDADVDGWTALNGSVGDPVYFSTGGNPGGYLRVTDGAPANATYFVAPVKFLGNKTTSYEQFLRFDLQVSVGTKASASTGDIQIIGSSSSLYLNLTTLPATLPSWTSYSLKLDETQNWKFNSIGGAAATNQQIKQVLATITALRINGEYITGPGDTGGIDNVVLEQRITIAPIITSFSPTSGKAGDIITIQGNGFGSTPSENVVSFGGLVGIKGSVQSATATQLMVQVPEGVVYGFITITNTTSGLSSRTSDPFSPVFEGGGRIIPASFSTRFSIATIQNEGWFVGDIDGDGWDDFGVANNNADNAVDIHRNLGLGGTLSAASFAAKVSVPIPPLATGGTNGAGLWFADLDGDGKLDAISSNKMFVFGAAGFITLRNISTPGNIAFEAPEYWAGVSDETPIALVADLDGDGRPEMIAGEGSACSCGTARAMWIVQNISTPGNIEFGASQSVSFLVDGFAGVSASDLDNDGKPELLVSWFFGDRFSIIKNNSTPGNISFTDLGTISTGQYNRALKGVDINLDGKNDLIWKKSGGGIYIRLNTNSGGPLAIADFTTEVILTSDLGSNGGFSIVDFNGDGKPDIASTDDADVGVYESVFTGGAFNANSFIPAYQVLGTGASSGGPGVVDLNHDGKPDFMMAGGSSITIVQNQNVAAPHISVNTVSPLAAPVGATVTITGNNFSTTPSDNKVWFGAVEANVLSATPNLITAQVPPGANYAPVSVTKNELTSRYHLPFQTTFSPGVAFDNTHFAPPVAFTLTGATYDTGVGDLNHDGKPDIIAQGGANTYAFLNTHTTGLISSTSLIPDDTLAGSSTPRLEDLDGDGYLDVMSVNGPLRKNNSTLSEISYLPTVNVPLGGSMVDFADFNNDGKTDMTITTDLSGTGDLIVLENRSITTPGNFATGVYGSFSGNFLLNKPSANGATITGDFDGDGFADIVTTNPGTDNISIYRNAGVLKISNAQFEARADVAVGDNPNRIYKGDFDSDGKLDLLVYHWTGTSTTLLIVLQNTSTVGNISFSRIDLTNPSVTTLVHIADLDGDGRPEILTTSEAGNRFSIFKNIHTSGPLTTASFAAPFNTTVTAPRGITTADLNLDGKPEIIITRAANLLVVYENLIPATSITITQQPASPFYACEGSTTTLSTDATGTTNITYQWQKFNSGTLIFENLVNNTTFSGVTTKTLSIANVTSAEGGDYRCLLKGDLVADVTTNVSNVVFNNLPSPPDAVSSTSCGPGSVTLTASGGSPGDYQWYTTSPLTLISGETNETYTTPVLSTSTQYAVSVSGTFCKSIPANATAFINPLPAKPVITSSVTAVGNAITICSTTTLTLSAPAGFTDYLWSDGSITPQISVTTAGTYSVVVKDSQGCSSSASDGLTVTIVAAPCNNSAPVINTTSVTTTIGGQTSINLLDLISDADNNLVPSSLSVIVQPASGATTTITNGILLIDYSGTNFTGTDQLTIQVCDVFGECVQQQLEIKVIGELVIYNAVSPNGDSKNEIFRLEYIDLIPETQNNKVTIYNRWGSKVFEVENYNNNDRVFKGLNENGNELPSGTYFYKIAFDSGRKSESGYLVLNH
ncbi:MAG: VCBS repeat-containing protein [Cyclobacteriaceae bacterium]|jgi:gliding motility-associated-like protein|nr:VCBS repeat-containing protein [Cyclobacteriaceae bacterium]